jgi:hypothetical protein
MRRCLPLLVAALCCALPAAAPAAPRASDAELRVGSLARQGATARAAGARASWTSRVVRTRRPVHVLGLRWASAPRDVHAEVRVREPGGRWHRWVEAPTADAGSHGTDPVWAGGATSIQVRLSRRVRGLRVHTVRVTGAPSRPRMRARAAQSQPAIIPRAQWGGDTQCAPRDTPSFGTVQMAFVHHTVSANDYGPGDSAAMVLGICRFHRNSNGWDDIGYNFLVDKYGQVFEGRAGGVDQPVVGAQAQGWNAQSTSVANLGTYQDVPQTDQAIDAMGRLLAWKLPLHGAPPTGTVTLKSAGGGTNRHPSGSLHTFERISGHRDGNRTDCPGAQLYAQLPRIRAIADSRAPDVIPTQPAGAVGPGAQLTLSASRLAFSYPEPAQLSGALLDGNAQPIGGRRVRIQVLTAKGYRAVASAVTGPDGRFSANLPTSRNRKVRALVGRVTSRPVQLRVAPALRVRAPARRVLRGRRAVLTGTLRPRKGTVTVEAARQVGTRFVRAVRVKVRARGGRFRAAVRLARPGLYRLRVRFTGDRRNAAAQSDWYVRAVRSASAVSARPPARPAR